LKFERCAIPVAISYGGTVNIVTPGGYLSSRKLAGGGGRESTELVSEAEKITFIRF